MELIMTPDTSTNLKDFFLYKLYFSDPGLQTAHGHNASSSPGRSYILVDAYIVILYNVWHLQQKYVEKLTNIYRFTI